MDNHVCQRARHTSPLRLENRYTNDLDHVRTEEVQVPSFNETATSTDLSELETQIS
jgi:hypothetical protein